MKIKRIILSLGLMFILNLAFPKNFVFAEASGGSWLDFLNPVENFKRAMREWLSEIATGFASFAFEILGEYVIKVTDLSKIPDIYLLLSWSQLAAGGLIILFFIKRVAEGIKAEIFDEDPPNYSEIIGSTVIAASLVFATPFIIERFLIPINNMIVDSIVSLGIDVNVMGNEILDKYTATGSFAAAGIHIIFMILIWAIAFLVFAVAGAIRYVDLGILFIMGPLTATSYTNRSQVYSTYWVEATAIIFTQSIHTLLAYLMLSWASDGTLLGIIYSIAGAVVALRGPQVLRQFIYKSGVGGMASGGSRFAAYKLMMKNIGK